MNEIIDYLQGETRVTRTDLVGTGVACGLEVEWTGTLLKIKSGFGISSDGFLLKMCESGVTEYMYNRVRPFVLPDGTSPEPWYTTLPDPAEEVRILVRTTEPDPHPEPNVSALGALPNPEDWVVALWLRTTQDADETCVGNCDDIGEEMRVEIVPLLVKKSHLGSMNPPASTPSLYEATAHNRLENWRMNEEDVTFSGLTTIPANIQQTADLHNFYVDTCNALKGPLASRIAIAHGDYATIAGLTQPEITTDLAAAVTALGTLSIPASSMSQYYYDFLIDVSQAYREFIDEAYYVASECCVDYSAHVRYLLLGCLVPPADKEFEDIRHYFRQSPTYDHREQHRLRARLMFRRILSLIQSFDPGKTAEQTTIKITPSADTPELMGKRAIPYYYDLDRSPSLVKYWNPDASMKGKRDRALGYHAGAPGHDGTEARVVNPLEFNIREKPFFRIEGHQGQDAASTYAFLRSAIDRNNLPIDLIALAVPPNVSDAWTPSSTYRDSLCMKEMLNMRYDAVRRETIAWFRGLVQDLYNFDKFCLIIANDTRIPEIPAEPVEGFTLVDFSSPFNLPLYDTIKLLVSETYLPENLADFKCEDFSDRYNIMVGQVAALKTFLLQHFDKIIADRIFRYSVPGGMMMTENVVRHLELVDVILQNRMFVELRQICHLCATATRITMESSSLTAFASREPGLEHLAGAPRGGTFVLVYEDDGSGNNTTGSPKGTVIGDLAFPKSCCDGGCDESTLFDRTYYETFPPLLAPTVVEVRAGSKVLIDIPVLDVDGGLYNFSIASTQTQGSAVIVAKGDPAPHNGDFEFNRPKVRYIASPSAPTNGNTTLETVVVEISTGAVVLGSVNLYVIVRPFCTPAVYAKDLYSAIMNEPDNTVNIYVNEETLWPGGRGGAMTLGIRSQPEYGSATAMVNSAGEHYIEYKLGFDDEGYEGLVTFEYELLEVSGRSAMGTVSVHVIACCEKSGGGGIVPVDVADYVWYVDENEGKGKVFTLSEAVLTTENPSDIELYEGLTDLDPFFIEKAEVMDVFANNDAITVAVSSSFFSKRMESISGRAVY
ncbi:MAG: hypothetical protein AAF570_03095, partial [Bacteroidota bacterium]